MMNEEQPFEPKPQTSVPPPKPPKGPKVAAAAPAADEPEPKNPQPKKETVRINLPPEQTAAPIIKLPTLPPGGPTVATVMTGPMVSKLKRPWWKFW